MKSSATDTSPAVSLIKFYRCIPNLQPSYLIWLLKSWPNKVRIKRHEDSLYKQIIFIMFVQLFMQNWVIRTLFTFMYQVDKLQISSIFFHLHTNQFQITCSTILSYIWHSNQYMVENKCSCIECLDFICKLDTEGEQNLA